MKGKVIIASMVLFAFARQAKAQQKPAGDSTLRGATTIEVIQSYKPEVRLAPKPEFIPELPPRDTLRPSFNYEVPQQTIYYTYHSLPLRPLALGRDSSDLPFPGYIKLAGGNFSTIYLDAGIANFKGANYETALHLHHLSQDGSIKNQKISLSGLEAEGTYHANANAWHLLLEGSRNQYHYYGYDHETLSYTPDEVKQTYACIKAGLDLKNEKENKYGINYHPSVSATFYSDKYDAAERTIALSLPFSKDIDSSLQLQLGFLGYFTSLKTSVNIRDNNLFQLTPGVNYHKGSFKGHVGLDPTFARGGDIYLLPDIGMQLNIPRTQFVIEAGGKSGVRQNTFEQLSMYNPYMFNIYEIAQTRYDEIYAGFGTNIGNHLTLTGRVSWLEYGNLPLFLNDSADQKNFYLIYDQKVNAVSLQGSLKYQVANSFSASVSVNAMNYYQSTYNRVWHEPGIKLRGELQWQPVKALTISAYANILDQIYALNALHEEVKPDPITDLGFGAEYSFIPRLSAFININNILNNRYERWYRYESYGLNIFGGLRLKF